MSRAKRRRKASHVVSERFTVAPALDGFEVIDRDGRPVAVKAAEGDARFEAQALNAAASLGKQSLARALQAA